MVLKEVKVKSYKRKTPNGKKITVKGFRRKKRRLSKPLKKPIKTTANYGKGRKYAIYKDKNGLFAKMKKQK